MSSSPPPPESIEFAAQAFKIWTDARHDSIESHLASNVVETLTNLKVNSIPSHTHKHHRPSHAALQQKYPDLLIGGITNGNGSPKSTKSLSHLFDFNVSAEDVGYGKPYPEIYHQAHTTAMSLSVDVPPSTGPWWVHVGDDMIKDVVASKGLEIRTIYTTEFKENDGMDEAVGIHITDEGKPTSRVVQDEDDGLDYLEKKIQDDFVGEAGLRTNEVAALPAILTSSSLRSLSLSLFSLLSQMLTSPTSNKYSTSSTPSTLDNLKSPPPPISNKIIIPIIPLCC
ncbi:hypothetical protein TL16_g13052 [Triparma laevis f. inornata]|uniref:Uncharacterized protein n=1 Tax=Triparma laevis f. inornata TaxID=1714386 RepID=A0A9W7EX40_9STRA|nr:hypothetical protein TL16_g13052 [Triparma laevis f. inornata]